MPPRPRLRALTPLLVVADLQRALDFYTKKLGFRDPSVHGEPPCFAMLQRDGFDLMLSVAQSAEQLAPHGRHGTWDLYLHVADVARELEILHAAGVAIANGPRDAFYGMREIELVDPDGHRICIAEDLTLAPEPGVEAWEGTLDLDGKPLRLVLKMRADATGTRAALDSLDQGALDLPIDTLERGAGVLRFEMQALRARYAGVLDESAGSARGSWSQGGRTWPLDFDRSRD